MGTAACMSNLQKSKNGDALCLYIEDVKTRKQNFVISFMYMSTHFLEIPVITKTCKLSFKGKVQSLIGATRCLVRRIQLLKVWCRFTKTLLKPVHVLGDVFFLSDETLCQWVSNKRSFFSDKDFTY